MLATRPQLTFSVTLQLNCEEKYKIYLKWRWILSVISIETRVENSTFMFSIARLKEQTNRRKYVRIAWATYKNVRCCAHITTQLTGKRKRVCRASSTQTINQIQSQCSQTEQTSLSMGTRLWFPIGTRIWIIQIRKCLPFKRWGWKRGIRMYLWTFILIFQEHGACSDVWCSLVLNISTRLSHSRHVTYANWDFRLFCSRLRIDLSCRKLRIATIQRESVSWQ